MAIFSGNRALALYAQLQTGGPRAINNTSGTWTSTGVSKLRYYSWDPKAINPTNQPNYKTGNSSPMIGVRGRQGASGTLTGPLIPSGVAGTPPDNDVLMQAIFGKAAVVAAGISVTYSLADALFYLFMPSYNKNAGMSSPTNTYLMGAIPTQATFKLGGNFLDFSANFTAVGRGDSLTFASYTGGDALLKGALTAFPVEPSLPTQNGNVIPGFGSGGSAQFGGSTVAELRSTVDIQFDLGIAPVADGFNDAYPIGFLRGLRKVSISRIQCIDSDGSGLNALKTSSYNKVPIAIALSVGGVAGSTITFNLANVQVDGFEFSENGDALDVIFPNAMAHQTTSSSIDDATCVLS
jgi:hypothetical protein